MIISGLLGKKSNDFSRDATAQDYKQVTCQTRLYSWANDLLGSYMGEPLR
jgi:hypothetical protein